MPPPRKWQKEACSVLDGFLGDPGYKHSYLQAPTGTGKTYFMAHYGNHSTIVGVRAIIVARSKLVSQHKKSLIGYGWRAVAADYQHEPDDGEDLPFLLAPDGHRWLVMTWQTARNDATRIMNGEKSRYLPDGDKLGILFFDECHIGGCTTIDQDPNGERTSSIAKILNGWAPAVLIPVSATGNVVNELLLGVRKNRTYVYTMKQAYMDGVLHPINMIQVDTGTTAKIQFVERVLGRSFEDLQDIEGDSLEDLAAKLADEKVFIPRIKSTDEDEKERAKAVKDQVIMHRIQCMVDIYLAKHTSEQALFYCPTIHYANRALEYFREATSKLNLSLRGEEAHTGNDDTATPEYDANISAFEGTKETRGVIDALFVVGMLREGFDMPRLRLAFDCRFYRKWKRPQIARLIQKLGRLTRLDGTRTPKRYYYARDIIDYYGVRNRQLPESPDIAEKDEEYGKAVIDLSRFKKDAEDAVAAIAPIADDAADDAVVRVRPDGPEPSIFRT